MEALLAADTQGGCLDFNPPNYVKCKVTDTRRVAYKILQTIARENEESLRDLLKMLSNTLLAQVPLVTSWNFKPQMHIKSHTGHVGLKNLGCICYMTAML
jgi:hypothetical protein